MGPPRWSIEGAPMIREATILFRSLIAILGFVTLSGCASMNRQVAESPVEAHVETSSGVKSPQREPSAELGAIRETTLERSLPAVGAVVSTPIVGTAVSNVAASMGEGSSGRTGDSVGTVEYRVGEDDELEISVYGDSDLAKTQTVRPDGKIAFPLVGDVTAAGLTPDELREQITRGIAKYVRNPRVTVLIKKYSSKRVNILGQVKTPGVLGLSSDISLLEGISRVGGVTENADLRGAVLLREGQMQPVNFDQLLRQGDLSQNVLLRRNDVILIPDVRDKKVFVLGQVGTPQVLSLRPGVTLVEAISRAAGVTDNADLQAALLLRHRQVVPVNFDKLLRQGDVSQNVLLEADDVILVPDVRDKKVVVLGEVSKPSVVPLRAGVSLVESIAAAGGFTVDAKTKSVLIIRGGLGDPKILTVDVDKITRPGGIGQNIPLERGDIVYVPRTFVADAVNFFKTITSILTPVVLASSGIVLGPSVKSILLGEPATTTIRPRTTTCGTRPSTGAART